MRRTQVGMRAAVAQALRLRQNFFSIVVKIGHKRTFFLFLPLSRCKSRAKGLARQKTPQTP
jgi:hypothetical protein